MVEHWSITPWMMFPSAIQLKETIYEKPKLAKQVHCPDGLLDSTAHELGVWLPNFDVMHLIAFQTPLASVCAPQSEAAALLDSKLCRWSVQRQVVDRALLLGTGCNSERAIFFHAPHSHHLQYWHSKSGQLMRGALLCDTGSFDKVPPKSHFPSQFTKSVTATSLL